MSRVFLALAMLICGYLVVRAFRAGPDPIEVAKAVILAGSVTLTTFVVWRFLCEPLRARVQRLRGVVKRRPRVVGLVVGMGCGLFLIVALEATFGVVNHLGTQTVATKTEVSPKDCENDARLGYRLVPNGTSTASKVRTTDGKSIYQVRYSTDAKGRRHCPGAEQPEAAAAQVAFFGGSFVFGEGVEDDETLPHLFRQEAKVYATFNYGCHGYGPNQMLAMLEFGDLELPDKAGKPRIGVYGYIDDHIGRAVGSMRHVNWFCKNHPCYEPGEGDRLTLVGGFRDARPLRSVVYWLLGKSQTLEFFGVNWPLPGSDAALERTVEIIAQAKDEFLAKHEGDEFYVMIYPGCKTNAAMVARLKELGICCFDYSDLFDPEAKGMSIEMDGHPTPEANRIVAVQLAKDLLAN